MRRDQIEGKIKVAEGRTLRGLGKVTGNRRMQAKGALRQAEGKVQEAVGKGCEKLEQAADRSRARKARTSVVRDGTVRVTTTKKTIVKTRRR